MQVKSSKVTRMYGAAKEATSVSAKKPNARCGLLKLSLTKDNNLVLYSQLEITMLRHLPPSFHSSDAKAASPAVFRHFQGHWSVEAMSAALPGFSEVGVRRSLTRGSRNRLARLSSRFPELW